MARKNTNEEVFKQLTSVGLLRDSTASDPGNTTLDAAIAAGVLALPVASETNFAADDLIRIGAGEDLEENVVASVTSGEITVKIPTTYAHASGVAVVERARVEIGEPTEDGVSATWETELTDIGVATSFRPYVRLLTGITYTVQFAIRNFSIENLAAASGIPETSISGTGMAATPLALRMVDTLLASEQNVSMYAKGIRVDNTTIEMQGWAVEMDPSQSLNLRSGEGTPINFSGAAKMVGWTIPALP